MVAPRAIFKLATSFCFGAPPPTDCMERSSSDPSGSESPQGGTIRRNSQVLRRMLAQVKGCLVPQQYGVPELGSVPLVAAVQAQQLFNRHPSSQTPNPACSEDSNQSLFEDSRHYEPAVCDPMTQGDSMETESFMDELRHSSGEGVAQAPPRRRNGHAVGGAAAAAAAAAVDRAKVASMLDALALQQPLFMSSKYVKIADLNRHAWPLTCP